MNNTSAKIMADIMANSPDLAEATERMARPLKGWANRRVIHRKSGRPGLLVDTMRDESGTRMYYFEQDFNRDGSASGWCYPEELDWSM